MNILDHGPCIGPWIQKHYQALVEDSPTLQDAGTLPDTLPASGSSRSTLDALTVYRVLARSAEGIAWLMLQPITGMSPLGLIAYIKESGRAEALLTVTTLD